MTTTVTARAHELPVTLDEAKRHLRVLNGEQDEHIQTLIAAATEYCEGRTGRSLRLSETVVQTYDCWPGCRIELNRQPVLAVSSLKYYDAAGVLQTVASTNYRVHASRNAAGWVEIIGDYSEPTHYDREDAIQLTYTAGYLAEVAVAGVETTLGVPATAKHAIKLLIGHWFNHAEAVNVGNITSDGPMGVDALLGQLDWGCYR
jgi:uncharacterized phiE125 gp8 family phage protein